MSAPEQAAPSAGVYERSQSRRRKKIEDRRKRRGGVGRTDGPRRRKGEPSYLKGRRIRRKALDRMEKADAAKTHDVVFGIDTKTGAPVLRLKARPKPEPAKEGAA